MGLARALPFVWAIAAMLGAGAAGEQGSVSRPPPGPGLTERLGFGKNARLLIVHADDVGSSRAVNLATFDALATGQVTSASVMVPCAAVREVAAYAAAHPEADLGLHLTLTSEASTVRWGPVAPIGKVRSLVDSGGHFLPGPREALAQIDPKHVEIELRAQIERARDMGLRPTHLDSHQFLLFFRPELFDIYLKMGRETGMPVLLARGLFSLIRGRMAGHAPDWESLLESGDVVLEDLVTMMPEAASEGWPAFYDRALSNLGPGVSEVIIHVGYESEEPPERRGDEPLGSAWRQQEFDFFTGATFKGLLEKHDVELVSWRDIAGLGPPR